MLPRVSNTEGVQVQSFRVKAGVRCQVCKANRRGDWISYQTTKVNEFDEPVGRTRSAVTFRQGRWLLRVKPHQVEVFNGLRWVRMKA